MRRLIPGATALILVIAASGPAMAQQATTRAAPGRVIRGHQIDHYEAIERVRKALQADPKNLTDWVLLGELAQEVALRAPAHLAPGYFRLEREAFENALKLQPDNPQFQAAAEFARQQEQRIESFRRSQSQATTGYLDARRRELARTGNTPTLRTYAAPATAGAAPGAPYQTYVNQQGTPYTYQEHHDSFFGPDQQPTPAQEMAATDRGALVKPAARAAPP